MKSKANFWNAYCQTFKDIVKNSSIFTTFILSVIFYSFFYPTAYKAEHAEALPIVIVDEEQSLVSNQIIDQVSKSPNVVITSITGNFAEAELMVKSHQADGILLLPNNLSNSLRRGETGGIGLYLSAANFLVTQKIGLGLAASIENALAIQAEKFANISEFSPAISIHQIPLFNTLSGYGSYVFPAVAPLIIHQTILLGLCMLIATYREKLWRPTPSQFWGLFSAIFTIGCLGCLYLFGFTFWLYDYPHGGNFWGMLLSVPIYVSCVIAISMFLASFLDMPERAGHVIVFTSIPLFLLSGTAWPHAAMPLWMQYSANALPSTQGIQLFIQLNQMGVPTQLVIPKLIYLASIGAIFLILSFYRLKSTPIKS
ncbi:ABC transporter permease [Acinetobacter shaoyimingii]|uniref:ABC transporter permease n=1 Tax=Acinetobacter shaoyimingii TaxID=2715164 RepID=A0A6G8RXA1_9GAMM|nr:ABC transporter permease [Acinetobacter shaoyimingii]NHB57892.1 ABC transporter permease [Acinetobacter shaoyimingii]QIO06491.1 ABC transporter permease [Acinetobacter shaoyimingii]